MQISLREAMIATRAEDEDGTRLPFTIQFCSLDEKRKEKSGDLITMEGCLRVKPPGCQEEADIITFTTRSRPYPISVHLNLILSINGNHI
jgi:hypothetical protein